MKCKQHPEQPPRLTWRPMSDGRRHVKAVCGACGAFLGWAEQSPANVAAADAAELSRPRQADLFGGGQSNYEEGR